MAQTADLCDNHVGGHLLHPDRLRLKTWSSSKQRQQQQQLAAAPAAAAPILYPPELPGSIAARISIFAGDIASYLAGDKSVAVLPGVFKCYGGNRTFSGPAFTVKCHECNTLVRKALEGPGEGCVLVVAGGGTLRCALLGDALGELAVRNGWQGIVVDGPIRDSQAMSAMHLGVKALGTCPLKSDKAAADQGQQQVQVQVQGVTVSPGDWVYADWDGILVSKTKLE